MDTPEKPKPKSLAERIARLSKSQAIADATKRADENLAKAIAKVTELIARLRPKK